MISVKKGFAFAILTVVVGCSANNSVNSVQQKTQTTQSTSPVPVKNTQSNNPQTSSSSQKQSVTVENTQSDNPQTSSSSQKEPVTAENTQSNNPQTIASAKSKSDLLEDTLIIPGKRVGPVTSQTTRADLVKIFGESNLKDETILQAEGTVSVPATTINSDTKRSFTIFWKDDTRKKIVYISGFGSEWKTPEAISVGTSFQELRQKLGEFKLTGLGWDYGGFINLEGTKLSKYKGKLSLRVAEERVSEKYEKQSIAVSGDQELSSTNPNFEPLDIQVYQITVNFAE